MTYLTDLDLKVPETLREELETVLNQRVPDVNEWGEEVQVPKVRAEARAICLAILYLVAST